MRDQTGELRPQTCIGRSLPMMHRFIRANLASYTTSCNVFSINPVLVVKLSTSRDGPVKGRETR